MYQCSCLCGDESFVSEADLLDINLLLQQLLPGTAKVGHGEIRKVLCNSKLAVARNLREPREGCHRIVGMATLVCCQQLTGFVGRMEDVIVEETHRDRNIGKRLILMLINEAKRLGLNYIDLTSQPSRQAANHIYEKLGFQRRHTNVFRLSF